VPSVDKTEKLLALIETGRMEMVDPVFAGIAEKPTNRPIKTTRAHESHPKSIG